MNLSSVVIASILKPIDDPRMFEKIGNSLAQTNKYEVNIIGFKAKRYKKNKNISFYPVFNFKRLSLQRLFAPLIYAQILFKVKPSITIINTPEILLVTVLYKLIFKEKVIYDIRENYLRNIIYNKNYIWGVKHLLGLLVRLKELACYPFIDHVFYSDEGYRSEMPFWNDKSTLIRNTYIDAWPKMEMGDTRKRGMNLLYSGTIAENYGIYEVIEFAGQMHKVNPNISLTIIGYSANQKIVKNVIEKIEGKNYIKLIGGNKPVPHKLIINAIRNANFGIINYKVNLSTANCFPTKIYEYMANKLPIIIQDHTPWSSFCVKFNAGIEISFNNADPNKINALLLNKEFYKIGLPDQIYWKNDEKKLLNIVQKTLI